MTLTFFRMLRCKFFLFLAVLTSIGLSSQLHGESDPQAKTTVRFINCVGSDEPVEFHLNKRSTNVVGYAAGKSSGWIGVPPGKKSIRATHPTLGSINFSISPSEGESVAIIALQKLIPSVKPGGPSTTKLRYLTLVFPASAEKARNRQIKFLSVLPVPSVELVSEGFPPIVLEQFKPKDQPVPAKIGMTAQFACQEQILATLNFEAAPSHAVIIYETLEGSPSAINFHQPEAKGRP
ncbi:hypothetical protein FEM03_08655 [Phragmitibacter flavus]|uniref:DUF4397 domain-containing protein n=1 Tax=Phragmitibacter flavus TaxID=2576071 RepID=A0A5R8KF93_9BACT|nr:hypothetical protein [Phragmitibacter flavus]TLD70980.1 hypothetical protein FEM03_08655 [Phragmitibacter flavus]